LRCFVVKPRRIRSECRAGKVGDAKGIAQIVGHAPCNGLGALAHQSQIRSKQQNGANFGIWAPHETVDARRRQLHDAAVAR
jgi:hypothetical protein